MLKWKKQNRPGIPTYTSGLYTIEKFEGRWTAYCNCPGGLLSDSESFKTLREAKARCQYHSDPCFGSMLALVCSH
jgi:hypothetical protein